MTIKDVSASIDSRMNKSGSADYDLLWPSVKQEAFNKGILEWVRRQKHGKNQSQEGDEETDMRMDDLQVLLKTSVPLSFRNKDLYVESNKLPDDYLYFKRVDLYVSKDSCKSRRITSYLKEEANVNELLSMCSFDFEETFHTIASNKLHLYHNKDFTVDSIKLTYYSKPLFYNFKKPDTVIQFKDDICSILIDEAVSILSSDIESFNQVQQSQSRKENNN